IPLIRVEPNPRSAGNFSIFTDAAWNPSTGDAGFGWILDDLVSTSLHAVSMTSVSSPLLAETLAVLTAMKFPLSRGLDTISVLSDSQILINTLNKQEKKLEIYGALCDIYLFSLSFKSINFSFIPRSENSRVDWAAK
ncbi:unnamed protein product, partial [Brassica rapa subsp. narinosa]